MGKRNFHEAWPKAGFFIERECCKMSPGFNLRQPVGGLKCSVDLFTTLKLAQAVEMTKDSMEIKNHKTKTIDV